MNPNSFVKPSPDELDRLVKDETRRSTYTRSLALIQDLLVEFSMERGGPRFLDENVLLERLSELTTPIGGVSASVPGDVIQNNVVENLSIALDLRHRAKAAKGFGRHKRLRAEIENFLDSLEETYRDILILMSVGLQASRVKRA
jgi:hypothetical protein